MESSRRRQTEAVWLSAPIATATADSPSDDTRAMLRDCAGIHMSKIATPLESTTSTASTPSGATATSHTSQAPAMPFSFCGAAGLRRSGMARPLN
jgi:hypothetical protein